MTIKWDTVTGLETWASYLVNGDCSGMRESEITVCDKWAESLEPWYVVSDVEDSERFTWRADLYGADCAGAMVCDYVVHCRAESES